MQKYKLITYYEPLLKANTALFVGTIEQLYKKFSVAKENQDTKYFSDADGSVIKLERETKKEKEIVRVVWLRHFSKRGAYDIGLLVHEVNHLVLRILEDKGITISLENEEIIAYANEHFFKYYYTKLISQK